MIRHRFLYFRLTDNQLAISNLYSKKSEYKTSSTPQTNWSHSLSQGTSAPKRLWMAILQKAA